MVRRSRLPLGLYLRPVLWSCQRIRFRQRCDPSGFIFAAFSRKSVVKVAATRGYGAEVVFCEPNIQSRTETTERIAKERGMTIVHPFDYWPTIYGQGMCFLRHCILLEETLLFERVLNHIYLQGHVSWKC
jgi:hypothetical protein